MKRRIVLFVLVFTLVLGTGVDAGSHESKTWMQPLISHSILIEGFSWRAYDIECQEGDTISGSFEVTCDGSLYIGDEQKYDDWSLEGIQFYIFDEGNYSLFVEDNAFKASFVRNDVLSLTWTFEVPSDGIWYIVYDNITIYLMNIDGSINYPHISDALVVIVLGIFGGLVSLGLVLLIKRK